MKGTEQTNNVKCFFKVLFRHIEIQDRVLQYVIKMAEIDHDCSGAFPNKNPTEIERQYPCYGCDMYFYIQDILEGKS